MQSPKFESKFTINFYDLSQYGEASPITMLRLLQETAGDHHIAIGENVIDLYKKHLGWVLLSGVMRFERYPQYKEQITIQTWISQYKKIRGIRENLVIDAQGNIIGRAKGMWLFFDVEKRRPAMIPPRFVQEWGQDTTTSVDVDISYKLPVLTDGEFRDIIKVKKFDIDANKHVNNMRYFTWLIEIMPDRVMEERYLYQIEGRFMNEANYGDQLLIYTHIEKMDEVFLHTAYDLTTNKPCVVAKTIWKKRQRE